MTIETLDAPTKATPWSCLEYVLNVYKAGVFVIAYRYTGYSGDAVMEELRFLRWSKYPHTEGYTIQW